MSRLGLFLVLVVGIVGGGLAATLLRPDEAKVRAIAAEVVAAGILPRSVKASSVINFVRSLRRRI